MDGNIKLSATVISCSGNNTDKDDFYFNGNFANCHNTQSIQCSFEKSSNNYIFAISDSMGVDNGAASISAIKEIKSYHESAKKQHFALENVTEKIYEAVQLSSNLIYSKSIISSQNESILTGFSSLIIDNNRATVMNLGNNGAFLYRQGEQLDIFRRSGNRKEEKLKMLGITPNPVDLYNDTGKILKLAEEESKTKIKLSPTIGIEEGDIIILCSDGLLSSITKSRINAVIDSGFDPSKMASILFQEASKAVKDESITIMVIKVEEIRNISYLPSNKMTNRVEYENDRDDEEEDEESHSGHSIVNYILAFICVIVVTGVIFMGYLIVKNSGFITAGNKEADTSQSIEITNTAFDTSDAVLNEEDEDSVSEDSQGENTQSNTTTSSSSSAQQSNSAVSDEYEVYVVKSGDTLSSISNKYYGNPNKYNTIIKYNNMKSENLFEGQELKIPKSME